MPAEQKRMTACWTFQVPDIPTDSSGQRVGSTDVSLTFSLSVRVSLTVIFWKISFRVSVGKQLNWTCLVSYLSSLFTTRHISVTVQYNSLSVSFS